MTKKITDHPSLLYVQDIADICSPLEKLNISYFAHVHVDNIGTFSALTNNPGFTEHYLTNKYYNADIHAAGNIQLGNYVIWDSIERCGLSEKMHMEASEFGVQHTFTIIESSQSGRDCYHFASNLLGMSINQVYLSKLELLKLFILHFREKVHQSKSLASAYEHTFMIDHDSAIYAVKNPILHQEEEYSGFLDAVKLDKRLYADTNKALTNREVQILDWMHRGKTAEQIAKILNVTEITINKHIAKIKEKSGRYTQFQLGELYLSMFNQSFQTLDQLFGK